MENPCAQPREVLVKTLQQLLDERARTPVTVTPTDSVNEAMAKMYAHDIGAVLVLEGEKLVGILSERDVARKVALGGHSATDTQVREIMSQRVRCVTVAQSVEECMALMTEHHIRHLPVVDEGGKVKGILSIGDMVKETISQQAFLIGQLEQYIVGG